MIVKVIVVGAGVIGCAIAERLARERHQVILYERDRVGAHASGAAAGLLAPYSEADEPGAFHRFSMTDAWAAPAPVCCAPGACTQAASRPATPTPVTARNCRRDIRILCISLLLVVERG